MTPKKQNRTSSAVRAAPTPAGVSRSEILAAAIVVLIAVLLRVIYLLQYKAHMPFYFVPIVDSSYYDAWATRVAEGNGFGPMPFYLAPLYPYVLALVYKVLGHSLPVVYILQLALGVCNAFLVYTIGRRLFGWKSAVAAMGLITLYAPLVYLETKLLTETLAIALNLTSVLLLMRALDRPTVLRWAGAGVVLGLSAVCRGPALITIALISGWLWLTRRDPRYMNGFYMRHLAPFALGIALAILPVTARNYFIGKDLVLISTNGGIVFAQGNNPLAKGVSTPLLKFTGLIGLQQEEEIAIAEKALGHPVKPSEASNYWFKAGLRYIRNDPAESVLLFGRKIIWSLHNREARCSYNPYLERSFIPILRYLALPFSVLAGLALFGMIRARRKGAARELAPLMLYTASVFLSLIIFSVSSRYRAPAAPALAVFAGFAIMETTDAIRARCYRPAALMAACVGLLLLISLVSYPILPVAEEALANLGVGYLAVGKTDQATTLLKEALDMNPRFAYTHLNLGIALQKQGKTAEALGHYFEAVRLEPDNRDTRNKLGTVLAEQGRLEEAIVQYSQALRIKPDYAEAHFNLGIALGQQGKASDAIREFRAAIRIKPDYAEAHHNLGSAFDELGRTDEAIQEYRRAIRIKPDLAEAHNNLAVALYAKGNYAEAWKEVRLCRKHGLSPHPDFLRALSEKMPDPED
ncbi:MAG TPA: tetratricopeptide repeat protein [Armatimonadota bacterium]|nr:tetratricopeptide repeat protein [Armatimonadota bacterium]